MTKYGFQEPEWERGKLEMSLLLRDVARRDEYKRPTITYGELAPLLTTIRLEPNDFAMNVMLGEISGEEYEGGRGMLSAVVVNKDTKRPGKGFFKYALELGREASDEEAFWVGEMRKVRESWNPGGPSK